MMAFREDVQFKRYVVLSQGFGEIQRVLHGNEFICKRRPHERGRSLRRHAIFQRQIFLHLWIDLPVGVVQQAVHGTIMPFETERDDGIAGDERVRTRRLLVHWIVRIQNGRFENRGSRCRAMATSGETENANMVRINMPFRRMITH